MEESKEMVRVLENLDAGEGQELIKALIKSAVQKKKQRNNLSQEEAIEKLREMKALFDVKHTFQANDIVMWKPNLKNRSIPEYNEPVIVLEVLETPVFDESETGSTYFREPLDIILGVLAEGELISFHYDSRKFQPVELPK